MTEKTEEYAPLYTAHSSSDKSESESDYDDVEMIALGQRGRRSASRWQRLRPWALHLGLSLLYTGLFFGATYTRGPTGTFGLVDCKYHSISKYQAYTVAMILSMPD